MEHPLTEINGRDIKPNTTSKAFWLAFRSNLKFTLTWYIGTQNFLYKLIQEP